MIIICILYYFVFQQKRHPPGFAVSALRMKEGDISPVVFVVIVVVGRHGDKGGFEGGKRFTIALKCHEYNITKDCCTKMVTNIISQVLGDTKIHPPPLT